MESINNSNNINIELALKKKQNIKKILKSALKKLFISKSKAVEEDFVDCRSESADNDFNEMLERRMESQENLINEQIVGRQEAETIGYCYVENDFGKFYWSADINRFVAVDNDLISSQFCTTERQQPQIQCC